MPQSLRFVGASVIGNDLVQVAVPAFGIVFTALLRRSYIFVMTRNERILVWLLRVTGVIMLTALGAVVMPFGWMNSIHQQLGLGALPNVPIVGYLTRSISALYALHGLC
jgi:hypothetical protein